MDIQKAGNSYAEQIQVKDGQRPDEKKIKQAADETAEIQVSDVATGIDAEMLNVEESSDDSEYEAIVQKADSGQTLTSAELNQLKSKDPGRYNKAVKAMQARDTLRQEMESDPNHAAVKAKETIASVQAQMRNDTDSVSSAYSKLEGNSELINALNNEYNNFAKQYDQVMFGSPFSRE